MRKAFTKYYCPEEKEFSKLWSDCIFIFDTNVLLNLYKFSKNTRDEWFTVIKDLNKRLFLPYHIGSEYHKNRYDRILSEEKLRVSSDPLAVTQQALQKNKEYFERYTGYQDEIIQLETKYNEILNLIKTVQDQHPNYKKKDLVRDFLNDVYENKVGLSFSEGELLKIYEEGEERFKNNVPPGFKDRSKKSIENNMYGDLIIWKQMLGFSQASKKHIIFVTDDDKEDWWEIVQGEKINPRLELMDEFRKTTGKNYWQYGSNRFLAFAKKYLKANINEKTFRETYEVIEENNYEQMGKLIEESNQQLEDTLLENLKGTNYSEIDSIKSNDEGNKQLTEQWLQTIRQTEGSNKAIGDNWAEVMKRVELANKPSSDRWLEIMKKVELANKPASDRLAEIMKKAELANKPSSDRWLEIMKKVELANKPANDRLAEIMKKAELVNKPSSDKLQEIMKKLQLASQTSSDIWLDENWKIETKKKPEPTNTKSNPQIAGKKKSIGAKKKTKAVSLAKKKK